MSRWVRLVGIVLAVALSTVVLPSGAAAARFCYCEVYCSNGVESYVQAGSRYECSQYMQQLCAGSGTWVCPYQ